MKYHVRDIISSMIMDFDYCDLIILPVPSSCQNTVFLFHSSFRKDGGCVGKRMRLYGFFIRNGSDHYRNCLLYTSNRVFYNFCCKISFSRNVGIIALFRHRQLLHHAYHCFFLCCLYSGYSCRKCRKTHNAS